MANGTNGGRIVPIVSPPQSSKELPPRASKSKRNKLFAEPECLEIPCLNELGLYALPTEGDGNCLYYALSDQVYGDFTHGEEIRARLADHISANKDYFMSFIAAVGGERRAPRRAAASAVKYSSSSSSSASPNPPSVKVHEQSFDTKVACSRKNGVWGGAEEIQAFCQSFKLDVNVYTMYGIQHFRDVNAPHNEERGMVHVAFHDFNHYSSVRHKDGPHTGLPSISNTPKAPADTQTGENKCDETPTTTGGAAVDMATPWKISVIQEGLGGKYNRETIIEVLQQCRGNIDRAFSNLLDESSSTQTELTTPKAPLKQLLQASSRSTSPFSTGSKRSAEESDDEEAPRSANRRIRAREKKRRILPDVTVGIAFRDDQNDLVSLRLRVSPDAVAESAIPNSESNDSSADPQVDEGTKHQTKQTPASRGSSCDQVRSPDRKTLRRSRRVTKTRNSSEGI